MRGICSRAADYRCATAAASVRSALRGCAVIGLRDRRSGRLLRWVAADYGAVLKDRYKRQEDQTRSEPGEAPAYRRRGAAWLASRVILLTWLPTVTVAQATGWPWLIAFASGRDVTVIVTGCQATR